MEHKIDQLAEGLRYEVTDQAKGVGRYRWRNADTPDPEVVGFLVNHYRSSSRAIADLSERLQAAEAQLAAQPAPAPIEVVEVQAAPEHPLHPEHPRGRG